MGLVPWRRPRRRHRPLALPTTTALALHHTKEPQMRLSYLYALLLALGVFSDQVGSLWASLTFIVLIASFAHWDTLDSRNLYKGGYRYTKK